MANRKQEGNGSSLAFIVLRRGLHIVGWQIFTFWWWDFTSWSKSIYKRNGHAILTS